MTVIAAASNGVTAALAYDSGTSYGPVQIVSNTKRIRTADVLNKHGKLRGRLAIAVCGRTRVVDHVSHRWDPPPHLGHDTPAAYMRSVAASLEAEILNPEIGRSSIDSDGDLDGDMLAIYHGTVFLIATDFSVIEPACGYHATGSGGPIALGALAALGTADPVHAVTRAVEVCCDHVAGILRPIHVVTI